MSARVGRVAVAVAIAVGCLGAAGAHTAEADCGGTAAGGVDPFGKQIDAVASGDVCVVAPLDDPLPTGGGGDGEGVVCDSFPYGPLSAVQAALASALAPPPDPTFKGGPGISEADVLATDWYRIEGNVAHVKYLVKCEGEAFYSARWFVMNAAGAPQVTAADLLPALQDSVVRRLPTPVPRVGPADEDPDGYAYVNIRTFFWVDEGPGQWNVVSGTASAGGVSVTVQAAPVRMVVDPGDGSDPVRCDGAPVPVTSRTYRPDIKGTCNHKYVDSSAMSDNGRTFPMTMSIVWHATWSANTGESGDLGYVSTVSATRDLPVAEIQSVITDYGSSDPPD